MNEKQSLESPAEQAPVSKALELVLPLSHPLAGRVAWQCATCEGIFFPPDPPPDECPYCAEDINAWGERR